MELNLELNWFWGVKVGVKSVFGELKLELNREFVLGSYRRELKLELKRELNWFWGVKFGVKFGVKSGVKVDK